MGKIIKTENLVNFCGGCNNQVHLKKFIQVEESQTLEEAWEKRHENEGDNVFTRVRLMGFCLCGNVWLNS